MKDKSEFKDMWVFIEHDGKRINPCSLELCCETRRLCDEAGEKLAAVLVGELPEGEREKLLACGIERLIHVSGSGYERPSIDAYTELFTRLCLKYQPSAVMVGGTGFGRELAPRFACRLETGCTSDATELVWNEKDRGIEFVEPAVGGKIMAVITLPELRPQVGTIRPGTFKYRPAGRRDCKVIEERAFFPEDKIRTKQLAFIPNDSDSSLNIADAEYIVCVGNGLRSPAELPRYRKLAELLGGKLACTRPVFDRGILPYKLVIGQSGAVVKPKVYLGFGVSGAVNHLTGISDADRIVAVNSDPDAPVFNACDYGIVGDMDEVCDAMTELLSRRAEKKAG